MAFTVGIIGAGWYGCHIGSSMASLGFQVTIFDKHARALHEASGNNQFRLHLGFHYARHHGTRLQSRDGFQRFIERYPTLSGEITDNIYAVPKSTSLIDFNTYKLIMASSGIDYVELPSTHPLLQDIEGSLQTRERVILLERARNFFHDRLGKAFSFETEVRSIRSKENYAEINGKKFDYVIDATWGQYRKLPTSVYFEPTLLLYYEANGPHPAVTFVDGPLCSVYPTEDDQIFTLSSVVHTPLGRYSTAGEAQVRRAEVDKELVAAKRMAMEDQISINLPGFREAFRFAGVQLAVKTKPIGQFDDRSCYVFQEGRIFSVMSGKIDTIFFATERILSMIEAENSSSEIPDRPSALRSSMRTWAEV